MKRLAIMAAAAFALSACSAADREKFDTAVMKTLPQACDALESVHQGFLTYAAFGRVKQSIIDKEATAYAGVSVICEDPGSVNSKTALSKVLSAALIVTTALKEARQ